MSRALLVGGRSFIGRHLAGELRSVGAEVVATSRHEPAGVPLDAEDAAAVDRLVDRVRPELLVDLSQAGAGGARNLLAAVARRAPRCLTLLFGSAAEYGRVPDAALPIRESWPAVPCTPYGVEKLSRTELALATARQGKLRVVVLRPFNVVGAGSPSRLVAGALADRLLLCIPGSVLTVADPWATRDLVDVRDAARAVVAVWRSATVAPGRPRLFNVASGKETAVRELAAWLARLAGGVPVRLDEEGPRSSIRRSCGDSSGLRRATGWRPRHTWRDSIRELWEDRLRAAAVPPPPVGERADRPGLQ